MAVPAQAGTIARQAEALQQAVDRDSAEAAAGELLFAAVALARRAGVDPEQALQRRNAAFAEEVPRSKR